MDIAPMRNMVLVAEGKKQETTASGIILSSGNPTGDTKAGYVVAIGPKVLDVKVGDKIYLDWSKGSIVKLDDVYRVMISEDNILGVVEEEEQNV